MRDEIRERIEAVRRGEVPDGYTKTEIGILPEEWAVYPLSEIATVIADQAGEAELETMSISAGIGFVNQAQKFGKELSGKQYSKYTMLRRGDFAYNKGNSKRYPQGCTYMLRERDNAAVPNVFECFRIKEGVPEYYEQLFIHGFMNKQLAAKINHGVRDDGLLNLTDEDFYSTQLPFPTTHEQRRIAEILDVCDRGLKLKQKLIIEKQKQKQWLASQILRGGHRRLLCGICPFICDGDWIESKDQSDAGIRLIQTGNVGLGKFRDKENRAKFITEETFDRLHCTEVLAGDVLVSRLPDPIGRACIVPAMGVKAITAVDCTILRFNDDNLARYFVHYTTSREYLDKVEALSGGSTRSRISRKEIEKLTITIPDSIEQIIEINNRLTVADKEIELLEKEVEAQYRLKKALMQLLLTGLVRVNA